MVNVTISVIVPCFNYGRYLNDAVHSLIGGPTSLGLFNYQTYDAFEIIIVDDASTDNTEEISKSFANDAFPKITCIRNPANLGTAATLNAGIRQAVGKYITFLSADDMMEATRLEKLYRAAELNPHRIVYDDLAAFKNGERTDKLPMPDYDFDRLLYKNTMAAGILYPRSAWQEVGGYPESFKDGREDWAFNVLLGSFGHCGVHVKEPLYLYRREGQNRSLNSGGAEWRLKWLAKMQAQFPALYKGERTIMCCGGKTKRAVSQSKSERSRKTNTPNPQIQQEDLTMGIKGMVLLEYQLQKAGPVRYRGAVTNHEYVFGGSRTRGYVDVRDAPALVDKYEKRRHAFIQVPTEQDEPATPVVPVAPPPPEKTIETVTLTIAPTPTDPTVVEMVPTTKKPRKAATVE